MSDGPKPAPDPPPPDHYAPDPPPPDYYAPDPPPPDYDAPEPPATSKSYDDVEVFKAWFQKRFEKEAEFEFDQNDVVDALLRTGTNIHIGAVRGGICCALSCDWAARTLCGSVPEGQIYQNKTSFMMKHAAAAQFQGLLAKEMSGPSSQVPSTASAYGLEETVIATGNVNYTAHLGAGFVPEVLSGAPLKYQEILSELGGIGLLTLENGVGGGHAVAFTKSEGGYRLFDPNFGGYQFADEKRFRTSLEELIRGPYSSLSAFSFSCVRLNSKLPTFPHIPFKRLGIPSDLAPDPRPRPAGAQPLPRIARALPRRP